MLNQKKPIVFFFLTCFFSNIEVTKSQTKFKESNIDHDTITISLNSASGIGPTGRSTRVYQEIKQYNTEDRQLFPTTIHKPENLSQVVEYCIFIDEFQFYYQNHRSGKYSKEKFLEKSRLNKWNLNDTVGLSATPIKCTVSIMGGFNENGTFYCIVDANNNNDYSDDVLKPLTFGFPDSESLRYNSIPVNTEYQIDGKLFTEKILIYPTLSGQNKIAIVWPQYYFKGIEYNGKEYFLVSSSKIVAAIPFQPYFDALEESDLLKVGHFLKFDDKQFKVEKILANGRIVKLSGQGVKNFAVKSYGLSGEIANKKYLITSDQFGFKAPLFTARNLLDSAAKEVISLKAYRGKYIFIDFWNTTCAPCIADFKNIKKVYNKYNRTQLEIIGVVEQRTKNSALRILKTHQIDWPNIDISDDKALSRDYKIDAYPTTFLLDTEGKIIAVNLDGEELMKKLMALISR